MAVRALGFLWLTSGPLTVLRRVLFCLAQMWHQMEKHCFSSVSKQHLKFFLDMKYFNQLVVI